MLTWNLETDQLIKGQWLKGRVYEHRCDLSPSGEYLVCFAAKHKGDTPTWTAISRPPYFSALVAFENRFGAWGGGGLFDSEHVVRINHRGSLEPLAASRHPRRFLISPFGPRSGHGEDDPIRHARLMRDGWVLVDEGSGVERSLGDPTWYEFTAPRVYSRRNPKRSKVHLEQRTLGLGERNGAWYVFSFDLVSAGGERLSLGRADWADWDHNGDLLVAKKGCLFRTRLARKGLSIASQEEIVNLSLLTFEAVEAPPRALA